MAQSIARHDEVVWCNGNCVEVPSGTFDVGVQPRAVIRLAGPVLPQWRQALTDAGIRVEFWCPPFGAVVQLHGDQTALRALPFIAGAVGYTQALCRRTAPLAQHAHRHASGGDERLVDLVCFDRPTREAVANALTGMGIAIVAASSVKLRVRYTGDLALLRNLDGVKIADLARAPALLSTTLNSTMGVPDSPAGLDGNGEIVAVADTGLDGGTLDTSLHADFVGRVIAIASWPMNATWTDLVSEPGAPAGQDRATGHGTHVAGLAAGNGKLSLGAHTGVAPAAQLYFQALEHYCDVKPEFRDRIQPGWYLAGRPLDLRELLAQARAAGARIHVNAWGDAAAGHYTDDCHEADLFLHDNPDAVVLFAAGNDGSDRSGSGRLDPGSLYAPASAKNVIAIGATEGPIGPGEGGLQERWADFDPSGARFANALDRASLVSGQPDRIACFSSTGPTADGRRKPDLCAPGTNIAAARSQHATGTGWLLADPLPYYMYEGGSSTATGLAGGLSALLRQAWRQAAGAAPSGPALKALLILGARPVRGRATWPVAADDEAGWGRINLAASLPGAAALLVDGGASVDTGQRQAFTIDVPSDGTVRCVLCWYDAPGPNLINDLDLTLERTDGSVVAPAVPDRTNTVELVQAGPLQAGNYVLAVTGYNVPAGPQAFAVAVTVSVPQP